MKRIQEGFRQELQLLDLESLQQIEKKYLYPSEQEEICGIRFNYQSIEDKI